MVPHHTDGCCAGSFDSFLNVQITLVLVMQLAICLGCALGSYGWKMREGLSRYHLALDANTQANYSNGVAYVFIMLLTFWILYSYLVPISLFVTMEIIKFVLVRPKRD